jgi:ABC-type sugar transport system ATPase subunit
MVFLKVSGINKKEGQRFSVKDINFEQGQFQKIAIAGETGSGKTTLLKMIAGLVQPDGGEIIFNGKRVLGPSEKLIPGHPGIAYLSQHFELRNNYRVEEELESKNLLTGKEADEIYSICRIQHLLKRKTAQLSGGERQRIVLARLLIVSPELLLLDEPFSNLDAIHKNIIKSVIYDIGEKLKITCIMVLHEAPDILSWADTILIIKDGQIIQQGGPEQVYRQPVNEYCAGLLGEYNLIDAEIFPSIRGMMPAGKKLLVRPEDFAIVSPGENGVKGNVQNVLFWGSYYTADVQINQQLIRIRVNSNRFADGDMIYLSISPVKLWFIDQ